MSQQLDALVTVDLDGGALACLSCGVAVAPPHAAVVPFYASGRMGAFQPVTQAEHFTTERMARCRACAANEQRAEQVLAAHPAVAHSIGGHSVAVHRVSGALDALAALYAAGHRTLSVDALTQDDRSVRLLLHHLTPVGVAARWSGRFTPVLDRTAAPGTASAHPWGHVDAALASALRDAYAALLRARVTTPRPIPPPADGSPRGCLLCGVATVTALPSAQVWTAVKVTTAALGGQPSPDRLPGHLCPTCARAADEAGGIGPTAMERSLMDHLGVGRSMAATDLVGMVAWCALRPTPEPSAAPWEHLGDLRALVDSLRFGA